MKALNISIVEITRFVQADSASGDLKTKIRCQVNKKINPENHALFDNIEQVYEF